MAVYTILFTPSDHDREHIDQELRTGWVGEFSLSPDLCSQIADRLIPFHFESNFEALTLHHTPDELTSIADVLPYVDHPGFFTTFELPSEVDPLWSAAYTGAYSAKFDEHLPDVGLNKIVTSVSVEELSSFCNWVVGGEVTQRRGGFVPPEEGKPTPFMVSMSRVGFYGPAFSDRAMAARFAIVFGDSIRDFCLSYCLPRIGHRAVWLPSLWIEHLKAETVSPLKSCAFSAVYARPYQAARDPGVKVCSLSEGKEGAAEACEDMKGIGLRLNGQRLDVLEPTSLVDLATNAPIPYCIDSPNQLELYPFLGNDSVGAIRSPRPTGFSKLNALKHRWVAEMTVTGRAIPAIPHVADILWRLPRWGGTQAVRVSDHNLAYACPGSVLVTGEDIMPHLIHPEIRLFDTLAAVSYIAVAKQHNCELSDKGIYQRHSFDKLGGLAEAARLFRGRSGDVLAKYLDHVKRENGIYDEGCVLHGDKRTYLDLRAVQKVMEDDEVAAVTLLDSLVARGVLYRGFILGCDACKHVEWYSLARLADQFQCTRCGQEQTIRRQHWRHPAAPQVFYKLDEIVYQFLKNDGKVVALGLDYMSRSSSLPFDYCPEVRFSSNDGNFAGEIDICGVWNGELTIGEAKKQSTLAPSTNEEHRVIRKYVRLAAMLHARRVVFCTASPEWKSSTAEAIMRGFDGQLAAPVLLNALHLMEKIQ